MMKNPESPIRWSHYAETGVEAPIRLVVENELGERLAYVSAPSTVEAIAILANKLASRIERLPAIDARNAALLRALEAAADAIDDALIK